MSDATSFTASDLMITDAFANVLHLKLMAAGIPTLCGPSRMRPAWWEWFEQRQERELNRRLNSVGLHLTEEARIRYHVQCLEGQGYDDASGYWLRCWAAAFALPFKPAWVSRSYITKEAGE